MTKRRTTTKHSSPAHASQQRLFEPTNAYLMGNIPKIWMCKWGITDHQKNRTRNVDETTDGVVFCIASADLIYGWRCEQFVHSLYRVQNLVLRKGSGRTEWFLNISPVVGGTVMAWTLWHGVWLELWQYAILVINPVVWLDGLFWLVVAYAGKVLAVFAVAVLAVYAIANSG